jgi:hypothetical protein
MKWDPQAQPAPIRVSNPTSCRYDPEGQMTQPCNNGARKLAYEGHNVIAAGNVGLNWSFVHGPALDDPLMGLTRWSANKKVFFWVTDGQGRQYGVSDSIGRNMSGDLDFAQRGGKYARRGFGRHPSNPQQRCSHWLAWSVGTTLYPRRARRVSATTDPERLCACLGTHAGW